MCNLGNHEKLLVAGLSPACTGGPCSPHLLLCLLFLSEYLTLCKPFDCPLTVLSALQYHALSRLSLPPRKHVRPDIQRLPRRQQLKSPDRHHGRVVGA